VKIDLDTYLIAMSNGIIYKYQYSVGSLVTYLSGYNAIQLKYDPVFNQVFVVESTKISVFDYPSTSFIHSLNSSEPIVNIELLYNR
jgi:hypothetical protein